MQKYVCDVCGYIYDPELGDSDNNIAPGTAFEDLPDDWECPLCGVGKDEFSKTEQLNLIKYTFICILTKKDVVLANVFSCIYIYLFLNQTKS